jgi:hypothetical protein
MYSISDELLRLAHYLTMVRVSFLTRLTIPGGPDSEE